MGERRATRGIAALRAQPGFSHLVDGVERSDFDEQIGRGWESAVDEFEIAERSQKRCAAASFLLPSLAGGKAERGKEAGQPLIGCRTPGRTQKRDALDHELILAWGPGDVRLPNFHRLPPCTGRKRLLT